MHEEGLRSADLNFSNPLFPSHSPAEQGHSELRWHQLAIVHWNINKNTTILLQTPNHHRTTSPNTK